MSQPRMTPATVGATMSGLPRVPKECTNFLLSLLPGDEYAAVLPHLELIDTPLHFKLFERDKPLVHAYFPCSGEHSILATSMNGQVAEVGTVGFEGFSTVDLLMENDVASESTVCQVPGTALRMSADAFKALTVSCPTLRHVALRYLQTYLAMVSQSVACNAFHTLEQRFARWLLMTHDRMPSDEFALTQEYIAMMLGTHRPTVSVVASAFQRAGILYYRRGVITIVDRAGLERACCDCYGTARRQFVRFLGSDPFKH
jgi:CRP-like cAMP-binding protein